MKKGKQNVIHRYASDQCRAASDARDAPLALLSSINLTVPRCWVTSWIIHSRGGQSEHNYLFIFWQLALQFQLQTSMAKCCYRSLIRTCGKSIDPVIGGNIGGGSQSHLANNYGASQGLGSPAKEWQSSRSSFYTNVRMKPERRGAAGGKRHTGRLSLLVVT